MHVRRHAKRQPQPVRHRPRRSLQTAKARGCQPHTFCRQVGRKPQHIAQKLGQRLAFHAPQFIALRGRPGLFTHRQLDALRPCKGAKHLGHIAPRITHRQPAAATLAQRGRGDGPPLNPAGIIGEKRRFTVGHIHAHHINSRHELFATRINRDLPVTAAALPFKMHAVEVQVQPRHRRVIADMHRLIPGNPLQARQGAVPIQEPPGRPLDALFRQPRHKVAQLVGLQSRVAPAHQHKVALHHPTLHRPRRQHSGDKAKIGAKPVQREE